MSDYRKAAPQIVKWEGGLSDDPTDRAAVDPVPATYTNPRNNKTSSKWHTNKGITWTTFKAHSSQLGYPSTPQYFFLMPENIWALIFKRIYWDVIRAGDINSQAIANMMAQWAWGSGVGGWVASKQKFVGSLGLIRDYLHGKGFVVSRWEEAVDRLNALIKSQGEKKTFDEVWQYRRDWLHNLHDDSHEKGWLNRMDDFYKNTVTFITSNPGTTGGIVAALAIGVGMAIAFHK